MSIVEDLVIKVGKVYFRANFIIINIEEDISMPSILGRRFLATGRANINLLEEKLRVGKEKQEFNVFEPLKYPSYEESCSYIAAPDELYCKKYVLE